MNLSIYYPNEMLLQKRDANWHHYNAVQSIVLAFNLGVSTPLCQRYVQ